MSIFSVSLVLFLILDPIGNMTTYLNLIKDLDPRRHDRIIFREMLIALFVMIGFNYLGEYLFDILDLSESTVRISSGVLLFLIAIKILFPSKDSPRANLPGGEPFIFPLAIPLIAGPALLATIMLFAHIEQYQSVMLISILIAWFCSVVLLYFSGPIKKILKTNGLMACERLIGMILSLIAVQRFLEGILVFWSSHLQMTQ